LVGLALRCRTLHRVFPAKGVVLFAGFDTYYHMRLVVAGVRHWLQIPGFDFYSGYPHGSWNMWPPLFDWMMAALALLAGLGSPGTFTIELVGAVFPAILGSLTILLVYLMAREVFDARIGALSALVFATMGGHVTVSWLGRPDHHVAESFFLIASCLAVIVALKTPREASLSPRSRSGMGGGRWLFYSLGAGLLLGCAMLTWVGAVVFAIMIAGYSFLQYLVEVGGRRPAERVLTVALLVLSAALALFLPVYLRSSLRAGAPISWTSPSMFQPVLVAGLGAMAAAALVLRKFFPEEGPHRFYAPAAVVLVAAVAAAAVLAAWPEFRRSLLQGAGFMGRTHEVTRNISESRRLLTPEGGFSLVLPVQAFGGSFFLLGPGLVWFAFRAHVRKVSLAPEHLLFMVWTIAVSVMAFLQVRFTHLASANMAAVGGYVFFRLWEGRGRSGSRVTPQAGRTRSRSGAGWWRRGAAVAVLLFMLVPNLYSVLFWMKGPVFPSADWYETLRWIRRNTPVTSFFTDPVKRPEYGVMARWDYGHWITYLAQRPVVANNFQIGLSKANSFILAESDSVAGSILEEAGVKYVVTDYLPCSLLRYYTSVIGMDERSFCVRELIRRGNEWERRFRPTDRFFNMMYTKLHFFDAGTFHGGRLGRYRLVFESRPSSPAALPGLGAGVKVFEYVKGARIRGRIEPGRKVELSMRIRTNKGREFDYLEETVSGEDGTFEFVVPYATLGSRYPTGPLGPYVLKSPGKVVRVRVAEDEVITGATLSLDP